MKICERPPRKKLVKNMLMAPNRSARRPAMICGEVSGIDIVWERI
jgi:hypothetical protein